MSTPNTGFNFLSLPAEIRLMIYREVSPYIIQSNSDKDKDVTVHYYSHFQDDAFLKAKTEDKTEYIRDRIDHQLDQIPHYVDAIADLHNLHNTCTQIRSEILGEFPLTQVHLRNHLPPLHASSTSCEVTHYTFFATLRFSALITNNVQHVSLYWDACIYAMQKNHPFHALNNGHNEVLDWLAECPQLKTLELIVPDPDFTHSADYGFPASQDKRWLEMWLGDRHGELFCEHCRRRFLEVLGKLETVVGRPFYYDDGPEVVAPRFRIVPHQDGMWARKEWFEKMGDKGMADDAVDVVEKRQGREYKFLYHFGAADVVWPLMDRIQTTDMEDVTTDREDTTTDMEDLATGMMDLTIGIE